MLKKIVLKPGINREGTRYSSEGGWYDCDKVRFRQGLPEKLGGWMPLSQYTYLGVCRSLWNWVTNGGLSLMGVGTNEKFYIESGGEYNDITPLRATATLANPFSTTSGFAVVEVADTAHGALAGDYVTFSGAAAVGGLTLNGNFAITTVIDANTYTITASSNASGTATGGGASVEAKYEISPGAETSLPIAGWGAGAWGAGAWGEGEPGTQSIRIWTQANFGEDLLFCYAGSIPYIWDASSGLSTRGVSLATLGGASDVPTAVNLLMVSDASRFVIAFGCNELGSSSLDYMLIRWSDQESAVNWTPAITNASGFLRLSRGSKIVAAVQSRQEILVWTNAALYSMQYQGPPLQWGANLIGDNISIASKNAAVYANGVAYWMGVDKFYKYDGQATSLRCDILDYVFSDINALQRDQIFCGTNEGFSEVWWFYCSADSTTVDRYAVYNYAGDIWYYGTMARTAWIDAPLRDSPIAATYENNVVYHEAGVDNNMTGQPDAMESYITSSQFDLDDGNQLMFISRILPDITFRGSEAASPSLTMYLMPAANSGSGYTDPASVGGESSRNVARITTAPIEEFTGQVYVRVRGRQMAMKIECNEVGVAWQLGAPRLDMIANGRR